MDSITGCLSYGAFNFQLSVFTYTYYVVFLVLKFYTNTFQNVGHDKLALFHGEKQLNQEQKLLHQVFGTQESPVIEMGISNIFILLKFIY